MSPAALSLLLHQKKGISEARAESLCRILDLSRQERSLFVRSVVAHHSRNPKRRTEAQEKIQIEHGRHTIGNQVLSEIRSWYSLALLELMELDECSHTVEWFSMKLKVNPSLVELALERLMECGMVKYRGGRYLATSVETTTDFDVPSNAIKKFHTQILKRAEEALYAQVPKQREFISMTLAFPQDELDDAKEMIRRFQENFADRFYNKTKKKKNSVCQLNVQLYRVDAEIGSQQ